ncbi:unnamed protein product [Arctia plantaginis]|uniref:Uncharacterized protein n=1 Tax=Arctia plantaginis TaxID=874455 RepID=A0A8S1AR44_ARCPL|nr:unnamed protein product [Arctia plantaginis]
MDPLEELCEVNQRFFSIPTHILKCRAQQPSKTVEILAIIISALCQDLALDLIGNINQMQPIQTQCRSTSNRTHASCLLQPSVEGAAQDFIAKLSSIKRVSLSNRLLNLGFRNHVGYRLL